MFSSTADLCAVMLVILLLLASWYAFRFVDKLGMYSCILSWQLTIWSLHVAPIVSLRCLGLTEMTACGSCLLWLLFSWFCRGWKCSIFSWFFLVLESAAMLTELCPRILSILCALQVIIVAGFWGGIVVASRSNSFSFMALDRHLRLGLAHVLRSAEGCRCLLHELVGHLAAQALFISILLSQLTAVPGCELLLDVLLVLGAYTFCVVAVATVLPPHELPYSLGQLPKALHWPLTMPSWLAGDGARGSLDRLRKPWWLKAPANDRVK